jgi:hypothetical protein
MVYNFSVGGKTADNTEFHLYMLGGLLSLDADGTLMPAFGTVVTVTPVSAIDGLPFSEGYLAAVQITPEGLSMIEPASLQLTLPAEYDLSTLIGFAADGDGGDFHLFPIVVGSSISGGITDAFFSVSHYSLYGVAQATTQEIQAQLKHEPAKPASQADQDLAPLVVTDKNGDALASLTKPVQNQLQKSHNKNVKPGVDKLAGTDCKNVPNAAYNFEDWKKNVDQAGQSDYFKSQIERDASDLLARLEDCLKVSCPLCLNNPSGKKVPKATAMSFQVLAEYAQSMAAILNLTDVANMWRELENKCAEKAGLPLPWPQVAQCGIDCATPKELACP